MAIIPRRVTSERDITTTPGVAPQSPDVAGVSGQELAVLGETLKGVADQFQKARTLEEVTNADTDATIKLNELQLEASQDPDVWSEQKYQEKITKVRESAGRGISIPQARDDFQRKFASSAIAADFNIRKTLKGRQIDSMKTSMLENIDTLGESYINAATQEERQLIEIKRNQLINDNVQLGVIDKEAAFIYREKTEKAWKEADLRSAIATDATLAKDMLLAGDFALSADETAKWTEVADKKIVNNKKTAQDMVDVTWRNNMGTYIKNIKTTTVEDLVQMVTRGELNPEKGMKLIQWKTDKDRSQPWGQYETNKTIWMEMARDSVNAEQDLNKFMDRISDAISNEQINPDEATEFVVQIESLYDTAIANKSRPSRLNRLMGAAIDTFANWARIARDPIATAYHMTKGLVKKISEGKITEENIEAESQAIIEDSKKVLNPNRAQFKIGDVVDTPAGQREVVGFDVDGEPLVKRVKK